jgi:hypothetical protein
MKRTRLGKLLSRLLEQLLVGLNNNSNKLLKLLKRGKKISLKATAKAASKKRVVADAQSSRENEMLNFTTSALPLTLIGRRPIQP